MSAVDDPAIQSDWHLISLLEEEFEHSTPPHHKSALLRPARGHSFIEMSKAEVLQAIATLKARLSSLPLDPMDAHEVFLIKLLIELAPNTCHLVDCHKKELADAAAKR